MGMENGDDEDSGRLGAGQSQGRLLLQYQRFAETRVAVNSAVFQLNADAGGVRGYEESVYGL
jgi:hypothetical protein